MPQKRIQHLTLYCVHASTTLAYPTVKYSLHSDISRHFSNIPANDKFLILGDFNASVRISSMDWNGVLDSHGVGNCNDNGRIMHYKYNLPAERPPEDNLDAS